MRATLHAPRNVRNSATKPAVAGSPSDDRPPIVNAAAMPGIIVAKPPILKIVARVRLLVDQADEREEQAGHDAVREHLEDGAVQAALGQRRGAEHDDAHVRDGRVGDDVLQVGLRHRAERAVDDVDAGDRADEPRPFDARPRAAGPCRAARRRRRRASSARRRAASTPRSAPRRGRRATTCAAARCRPGCRTRRRTRGRPTTAGSGRTAPAAASRNENDVEPAADVERQDADQDERRPEQQVQRQLHRRVFLRADACAPIRPAEDALRAALRRSIPRCR